jgi:hypothetical protein
MDRLADVLLSRPLESAPPGAGRKCTPVEAAGRGARPVGSSEAGVPGMALRSEVKVLSRGPDRGNPTSMRQGRGPELTGRLADAVGWCRRASVRAGLEEAVDAPWWRTEVKRRKAFLGWASRPAAAMPDPCRSRGRSGDAVTAKSQRLTPGDLLGSEFGRPEDEGDEGRWPSRSRRTAYYRKVGLGRAQE